MKLTGLGTGNGGELGQGDTGGRRHVIRSGYRCRQSASSALDYAAGCGNRDRARGDGLVRPGARDSDSSASLDGWGGCPGAPIGYGNHRELRGRYLPEANSGDE